MKWTASLLLLSMLGCATPTKKHHATVHHRKTVTHKVIARENVRETTPSEDAAVDAIIKSLRENGDED